MNPGMKVKLKRIELGINQKELAKKVDISNVTLGKIERGEYKEMRFITLVNLAKELGLDFMETFLSDED
ncbi:hypothetical protein CBU02nite_37890 [Clostridium butyricum]|uniref:HTH cro/C1-type domain-containing protein n=1 Tax=Clostridium butyricum TaxID=1492 RepID=A0A512TT43_CLOBU|nr:helix-turn-helix transcriptional regulator [Clostridium butyricum]NOW25517.1 putative transcriptional regulator [Clostridium butyricum]GEQ23283.1 hypothetical protein CBU02nite_37890 [Clostridium butyricum]